MIVHLNGQLLPRAQARVDPLDRGFIFGEGVYEGLRAVASHRGPRVVAMAAHARRMQRGLDAARIPFDAAAIEPLTAELLRANALDDAFVYWQVTGGAPGPGDPPRSRAPGRSTTPTVFGYCAPQPPLAQLTAPLTRRVITLRDPRWSMGWLKSISLMGNVHAAKLADDAGCDELIFVHGGDDDRGRGGVVSEGLATNVLLALPKVGGGTELVTPALTSAPMLEGVTRQLLLKLDPSITEREVREPELARATEIMLLGTTTMVAAVTHLNGAPIADATPGPHTRRLHTLLIDTIRRGLDA